MEDGREGDAFRAGRGAPGSWEDVGVHVGAAVWRVTAVREDQAYPAGSEGKKQEQTGLPDNSPSSLSLSLSLSLSRPLSLFAALWQSVLI